VFYGIKLAKSGQNEEILQKVAYTFVYVIFFLYLCALFCVNYGNCIYIWYSGLSAFWAYAGDAEGERGE
jgi:hypothetical protein